MTISCGPPFEYPQHKFMSDDPQQRETAYSIVSCEQWIHWPREKRERWIEWLKVNFLFI